MKLFKRAATVAALLFLACRCVLPTPAASLPAPPEDSYVLDSANVISDSTETMINTKSEALFALTGAQIAVVAVENSGYSDMERFSYELFNYWGIGSAQRNNGILFAMETDTYKFWVTTGSGISDKITASMLDNMFQGKMEDTFDSGDFDGAAKIMVNKLAAAVEDVYGVNISDWDGSTYIFGTSTGGSAENIRNEGYGGESYNDAYRERTAGFTFGDIITVIAVIVLAIAFIGSFAARIGAGRSRYYGPYYDSYYGYRPWFGPRIFFFGRPWRRRDRRPPPPPGWGPGHPGNSGSNGNRHSGGGFSGFGGGHSGGGFGGGHSGGGFGGGHSGGGGGGRH